MAYCYKNIFRDDHLLPLSLPAIKPYIIGFVVSPVAPVYDGCIIYELFAGRLAWINAPEQKLFPADKMRSSEEPDLIPAVIAFKAQVPMLPKSIHSCTPSKSPEPF